MSAALRRFRAGAARPLLIATAALALLALTPAVAGAEPLTYSSLNPDDGANVAGEDYVDWELFGARGAMDDVIVRISREETTGSDGVLASYVNEDPLYEYEPGSGSYFGYSGYWEEWRAEPGTYYWQVVATYVDRTIPALPITHTYTGPVRSITSTPPVLIYDETDYYPTAEYDPSTWPPTPVYPAAWSAESPHMSDEHVALYVRKLIRRMTARKGRFLHKVCERQSDTAFRCLTDWYDGRRWLYAGQARFRHYLRGGKIWVQMRFRGERARLRCVRHRRGDASSCYRKVRFP